MISDAIVVLTTEVNILNEGLYPSSKNTHHMPAMQPTWAKVVTGTHSPYPCEMEEDIK